MLRPVFLSLGAISVAAFSMFPHDWHGPTAIVAHTLAGFGAGLGITGALATLRRKMPT